MKSIVAGVVMITALLFPKQDEPKTVVVPQCKPTLREMVDIVATWKIKHEPGLITREDAPGLSYWGLTEPADNLITLSDKPALPIRKMVVIHEFIHACYRNIGLSIPVEIEEHFVAAQAEEMYKELYGNER